MKTYTHTHQEQKKLLKAVCTGFQFPFFTPFLWGGTGVGESNFFSLNDTRRQTAWLGTGRAQTRAPGGATSHSRST